MKTVGYVRVSTDKQADRGVSLDAQAEKIRARSVKDLCELLEWFERRGVALISVAESLDTSSAARRLVLNIMTAVS